MAACRLANVVKKYVPKKIAEAEIQEIRDSVEFAYPKIMARSPELKPHYKRMFSFLKDGGEDSFPAEQIQDEMCLLRARYKDVKYQGEDVEPAIDNVLKRARARNDHDFFRRYSEAIKSPPKNPITPTESFLLFFWARGSFAFTEKDNFPPLVLFTVKDLSRIMQVVFETSGTTESSLEAIIGRKLKLKTIKHCKVTSAQAERWINQFKTYKANHSAQSKDRLDMWGNFLLEQEFVNHICKKFGLSPTEAKGIREFYIKHREAIRRYFEGKHSDKASQQPRRHV